MRAKFKVQSITKFDGTNGTSVKMSAVYGSEGENHDFWNTTPSGQIEMFITNLEAVKQLELGKNYYIDFIQADS
jgi:hypothetical protein